MMHPGLEALLYLAGVVTIFTGGFAFMVWFLRRIDREDR